MKFFNTLQTTLTLWLIASVVMTSCITRNEKMREVDALVYQQNFEHAYNELESIKKDIYHARKDKVLYLLDTGLLSFYAGNAKKAQSKLKKADALIEEYRTKSISEAIGSLTVSDTVLTYGGSSYENIFTSMMLSLGYLAQGDFDGGFVEIRRTQDKINHLQNDYNIRLENYTNNKNAALDIKKENIPFVDSAFARLLSFWLYRADRDFTNMEVAARKYNEAIRAQPHLYSSLNPPLLNVNTVLKEDFTKPRLQIVALTGRVPFKLSNKYTFNSLKNGVIVTAQQEHTSSNAKSLNVIRTGHAIPVPGMVPGISIVVGFPTLTEVKSRVKAIEVTIDNEPAGKLTLTESLENIATATFEVESKIIYARTFSRTLIKMTAVLATRLGMKAANLGDLGEVLGNVFQVTNNVTEKADTRSVRYYPARIWTSDIPVSEVGEHLVTLIYKDEHNAEIFRHTHVQKVSDVPSSLALVTDVLLQ